MTWKPHVTVAAVVCKNDKFLLVEEISEGLRVFNQPAGHLDPGESVIDAVIRETREETTLDFTPNAIVGLYRWQMPQTNPQQTPRTYMRYTFSGETTESCESRQLDTDIIAAHWFSYAEIIAMKAQLRSPLVLQCIDDYLAGESYPLSLIKDIENE